MVGLLGNSREATSTQLGGGGGDGGETPPDVQSDSLTPTPLGHFVKDLFLPVEDTTQLLSGPWCVQVPEAASE